MADDKSDTPEIGTNFEGAASGEETPKTPASEDTPTPPAEKPERTTNAFNDVTYPDVQPGLEGTVIGSDGTLVQVDRQKISMGNLLSQVMLLLKALFSGEWEDFTMFQELFFPKDVYTDPVERETRSRDLYEVVRNPEHPSRGMAPADFVKSYFGTVEIRGLLDHIARHESVNGSYDSVWPNSVKDGLSEMTINEVIAWQESCNDKGSCAAGRYQFMPKTLKGLIENMDNIDGTEKFSPNVQDLLAVELMREKGLDGIVQGKGNINNFVDGIAEIWQAFKNTDGVGPIDNTLGRATVDARETINVVKNIFGITPGNN
ncbi:MAG: hypothetical protein AAF204_00555 [Pseudomonadota bacterium]